MNMDIYIVYYLGNNRRKVWPKPALWTYNNRTKNWSLLPLLDQGIYSFIKSQKFQRSIYTKITNALNPKNGC